MIGAPLLGELAVRAGLLDEARLGRLLEQQRVQATRGELRRLGDLIEEATRCGPGPIRGLLEQQGVLLAECSLCGTRYNGLRVQRPRTCPRCERPLRLAPPDAKLVNEDAITDEGPEAAALLAEYRRRSPRIGRFEVLGEVGRGAMGVVYKAWDPAAARPVALKLMLHREEVPYEEELRFRREAEAVASLEHEHVVRCFGIEEADGLPCMVMEFLRGASFEVLRLNGALSTEWIVRYGAQVARALAHAHGRGLIHRDVKPANIMISPEAKAYLVDFGIMKSTSESVSLTLEGEVLGSLAFMAPEYVSQGVEALDPKCDVYGLGVVLYEALSGGELPFGDPDDEQMVVRLVTEPPVPLLKVAPQVAPVLAAIVMRAIAKERSKRHPSAEALASDLEAFLSR